MHLTEHDLSSAPLCLTIHEDWKLAETSWLVFGSLKALSVP